MTNKSDDTNDKLIRAFNTCRDDPANLNNLYTLVGMLAEALSLLQERVQDLERRATK